MDNQCKHVKILLHFSLIQWSLSFFQNLLVFQSQMKKNLPIFEISVWQVLKYRTRHARCSNKIVILVKTSDFEKSFR